MVVGLIVFSILVVIQFIVITNGAGRVAEVAARFTLDAMPGKQMAIDADLNAGIITDEEAKERRETVSKEADFYGAMDGASKFVKGDAIAGIIIVFINLVGGLAIGMLQQGLSLSEAAQRFSLLTVGDGLVSQIPALLISIATGIIVTRSVGESNLGEDLARQVLSQPRAMYITGAVVIGLGLLPGLPTIPFMVVGALAAAAGYMLDRARKHDAADEAEAAADVPALPSEPENVAALLPLDPLELEIGYGLVPLVDKEEGGDLLGRVAMVRRQMATDLGISLQPIRIRDNIQLASHEYAVKIRGVEVARWALMPGQLLAMDPGTASGGLAGPETTEPAFGLPAIWIGQAQRDQAELAGYTVIDPTSLIVTHLSEVIRGNAAELLSRQDVRALLDSLKERLPATVDEVVPDLMSVGEVQRVLQGLLGEGIPIRDLGSILEVLGDKSRLTKDIAILTEYCRQGLARTICARYVGDDGILRAVTLDPQIDREIAEAVARADDGAVLNLDPNRANEILTAVTDGLTAAAAGSASPPVLLTSSASRRHVHNLVSQAMGNVTVLSYHEILPSVRVEPVGVVSTPAGVPS